MKTLIEEVEEMKKKIEKLESQNNFESRLRKLEDFMEKTLGFNLPRRNKFLK